jgi:hypothetical protein
MNVPCPCSWEEGTWFPCAAHRHLSQPDLEALLSRPDLPELDFCGRCHDHASFAWTAEEGYLSTCCSARPVPVDVEAPDA